MGLYHLKVIRMLVAASIRLTTRIPGFFEAKAILLGRMGRHENALEIYVYRLHDYLKAEEYVYPPHRPTANQT